MAQKINSKGWTCVKSVLGIMCHRNNKPLQSVTLETNEAFIVEANKCTSRKTSATGRMHTRCRFKD